LPLQSGEQVVHLPLVQLLPTRRQLTQGLPPEPQKSSVSDVTQSVPLQQPEQLFTTQVPPQPFDAPGHFPAQLGVQELHWVPSHFPPWRVQSTHAAPPAPQAALLEAVMHWLPLQHPVQVEAAQVPPQPSEAPAHLPAQSGVQAVHLPLTQAPPLARQVTQGAPPEPHAVSVGLETQSPFWQQPEHPLHCETFPGLTWVRRAYAPPMPNAATVS
jgi:hypothetical protein